MTIKCFRCWYFLTELDYAKLSTLWTIAAKHCPDTPPSVWLRYGDTGDFNVNTLEDLKPVVLEYGATRHVNFRAHKFGTADIIFNSSDDKDYIGVVCDGYGRFDPKEVVDEVASALGLDVHRWPESKTIDSIFVCFAFDPNGRNYVAELSEFLRAAGIKTVTAEPFKPGPIPAKVKTKMEAADAVIAIVSPQVDHTWIHGELAHAKAKEFEPIILVQNGIDFKAGILGDDYEIIYFPKGHIAATFTKVLEGLASLRGD